MGGQRPGMQLSINAAARVTQTILTHGPTTAATDRATHGNPSTRMAVLYWTELQGIWWAHKHYTQGIQLMTASD
jgi:hypothetical protein